MKIETILRLMLAVTVGLALLLFLIGLRARKTKARRGLMVVAGTVTLILIGGAIPLVPKIGSLVLIEGMFLAVAFDLAILSGLVLGKLQESVRLWAGVLVALLVALDLFGFYRLNHGLVEAAKEMGWDLSRKKYDPKADLDCPENLKKLYFAFSAYVDGNGSLPPVEKWMEDDELVSKVQKDEWLHCPAVSNRHDDKYGYAYNDAVAGRNLQGKKLSAMPNAATTPLLYDSTNLAKSAHDALTSLPKPGRHGGHNFILYCDGHVEAVVPK